MTCFEIEYRFKIKVDICFFSKVSHVFSMLMLVVAMFGVQEAFLIEEPDSQLQHFEFDGQEHGMIWIDSFLHFEFSYFTFCFDEFHWWAIDSV